MASGLGLAVLLGLAALGGAVVVAVATLPRLTYLERRIEELEIKNESLRLTTVRQGEHIQSLAGYLKEQDRRITGLEGEVSNLGQQYDDLVAGLEHIENQVEDQDVKKLIMQLIERANQRKRQRVKPVPTYFTGFR